MPDKKPVTRLVPPAEIPAATTAKAAEQRFQPLIKNTPDLPAIDWAAIGKQAPASLTASGDDLPAADAVVITWADAEWAALQHVFCQSDSAMPYSDREKGEWPDWQKYDKDLPQQPDDTWTYWGEFRLVQINGSRVLLFKSNTHLDWPGESILEQLIGRINTVVKPKLLLSIGTAGGAKTTDHIGTVSVVRAGTLYETGQPQAQWPEYSNGWEANWSVAGLGGFAQLLFPIPTVKSDLEDLCTQYNAFYHTNYTLDQLDPNGLNSGDAQPALHNLTDAGTPLLTTSTFVVATTAGNLDAFACVEMDDAVIAKTCLAANIAFGFVRNISDPVQNATLSAKDQGHWGEAIYTAYGLYTSYNGAMAAWAILDAGRPMAIRSITARKS